MDNILITEFKNTWDKDGQDTHFTDFIKGIRDGKWQDQVLDTRVKLSKITEKSERNKVKQANPLVRVSGSFSGQNDKDLRKHSGYIAIDIDGVKNPNAEKKRLEKDPYVYAAFISISGTGLCLVFRIDGSRHLDAFNSLSSYLYNEYQLISDQSCKNISRARYVSYDPHIHINEDASIFKKYLPKPKVKKVSKVVYVSTDLDRIISDMHNRGINVCEDYSDWIGVCYALASHFKKDKTGLDYFHTLSSLSSKYSADDCDKQYASCLRTLSTDKEKQSTINTIYHHAKVNGIETYSKQTKDIIRAASSQHKAGLGKESIAKGLKKFHDIPEAESLPIIDQVIKLGIDHQTENIIDDIMYFLQPYRLRKNLITRNVEMNGKPLDDSDINTIFVDCKSAFDKATKDLVCSVVFSNKIEQYNPVREFFEQSESDPKYTPNLNLLLDSVNTDTENYRRWITKWLVSIVASAYGDYSPLVLVFSGHTQGTGKTHWMRYLLPKNLRYLFGESDMDSGKDDEILMTKKLIILDDEYGGKSKKEEKKLKKITAKEFINVREPYGRVSVDLRRIAVFCGTSNDNQILSDPTGNRRVLPINIISLSRDSYNEADKTKLWHELYALYKDGYDYKVLDMDIKELNANTEMFASSSPEEELLFTKLATPENSYTGDWMTITEIIKYITLDTKYVFSNVRIGLLLTKLNFEKKRKKRDGNSVVVYHVQKVDNNTSAPASQSEYPADDDPF